ncbi:MAG: tRNA uridine-5-carboxymethylaminomethyl(34) synthesis GTPase MnmE, partial [Vicinamibacteria bacterium]
MSDTILALSTPPGRGAIAVVRLSGPDAPRLAGALTRRASPFPERRATLARLSADPSAAIPLTDRVVVTRYAAPRSYTGEDVIEIACHGAAPVVESILVTLARFGARLAEPGEFTLRAFLNGRMDLAQAEAVADLVNATTPRQAASAIAQLDGSVSEAIAAIDRDLFDLAARLEASLDFPEEGYHFADPADVVRELQGIATRIDGLLAEGARVLREGAQVAIAGRPNVGKSSLFNALVGASRAIVSAHPGTTRDVVSEQVEIAGVPVRLLDTAGVREAADDVEREGVTRARAVHAAADLALLVLDGSVPLTPEDHALLALGDAPAGGDRVVVVNKADLPPAWDPSTTAALLGAPVLSMSAATGSGLETLKRWLSERLGGDAAAGTPVLVTNVRHLTLLERARA